jgi:hypothetical protein
MNNIPDRITDGVAGGMVASPFWLPYLQDVSEASALIVPILGVCWLVVQIVSFLWSKRNANKR